MDGVFMRKIIKLVFACIWILAVVSFLDLWQDKQYLQENLIRLHVVANSDEAEDQMVKLQVRDAIIEYLRPLTERFDEKEQAMQYIGENLFDLQEVSNTALKNLGISDHAVVTLQKEKFNKREYDTFSLPSGIYDSLRIEIGEGKGKNWWCVVFPSLCLPATSAEFYDMAVSSGFDTTLSDTLSHSDRFAFRFFILDCLGKLENLFAAN